jgi:metal-sulfur cluster biosynthetic enzyme
MASAVVAALERAPGGSVFNVCDDPLRLGDYQDHLATLVGAPPPRRDPKRPLPPSWRCSSEAARTWLGWKPSRGIWPGARATGGSLETAAGDPKERGDLSARIAEGLRHVLDPELGVNVVDLGLVYRVTLDGDRVEVLMTMTSPACPLGGHLTREAEAAVRRSAPEVGAVAVRLVLDPPWHPGLMSDAARRQLGWGG